MYPVPWVFPPMFNKIRSKSPKKFKPKKQRSGIDIPAAQQSDQAEMESLTVTAPSVENKSTSALGDSRNGKMSLYGQIPAAASGDVPITAPMPSSKRPDGPFSSQLDEIAHQAALQPKTNIGQPSGVDLTTIRNVSTQDDCPQIPVRGYSTVPSRRRNQRHMGNGLYSGRGNVGLPLYATAPFPMPVPPIGRPIEQAGGSHTHVGYAIGSQGCGTVEIGRAAEHGGIQACNTCEPDH